MNNICKMGASVKAEVIRRKALIKSVWEVECHRDGKLLWYDKVENVVTNEGLTKLLNVMFAGATQITTWYVLIFTGSSPTISSTYAVPIFTESNKYDEATRPAYVEVVASQSCTNNASKAVFTINDTVTIDGAALVGGGSAASTISDTAGGGTLYCAADFSSAKACVNNDVLSITITLSGSDV